MQLRYVIRKQVSQVDLQKDGITPIGIVVKDGVKTGSRPVIKVIKKGSIAYRSHCVSEKDAIVSVCGLDARGISKRDFKHLLREAESNIELKLEYQIQEACLDKCGVYRMDRIVLKLKKESESYGFILRKSASTHSASLGYPILSNIKEGGPADRDGRLKAGDRVVQIDGQNLDLLSLSQVADILQAKSEATFTIEYKIALIENSQVRLGERTNLDIDCPDEDLGLVLGSSGSRIVIEEIHKGSLADRCGALRIGDDILAINDTDVAFMPTSKANSLLRRFKKAPGRLTIVANTGRLTRPRQHTYLTEKRINPLSIEKPSQSAPDEDQQVPSNDDTLPCNISQSLFDANIEDNKPCVTEYDCYKFQIKTIVKLRELVEYVVSLENFVRSSDSNNITDSEDALNKVEMNNNQNLTFQCGKLSHLKALSTRIKNSAYSMAMHLAKNDKIFLNRRRSVSLNDCFTDNSVPLNNEYINQVLTKNLVEIYTKKLISKYHLDELQLKVRQINLSCWKCKEWSSMATLTTQKILLIASLNGKSRNIRFLIKKFTEDIFEILPCEDCIRISGSQTRSDVSKTISDVFLNRLPTKPSSSSGSLNAKSSCSGPPTGDETYVTPAFCVGSEISNMADRKNASNHLETKLTSLMKTKTLYCSIPSIESGIHRTTDSMNCLGPSSNKQSSSAPFFLPQPRFRSSAYVEDCSRANVKISKALCREAVPNGNCDTENKYSGQPSHYHRLYYTELESDDNDSLYLTTASIQSQKQSDIKVVQNDSLGFATPSERMRLCDGDSIVGNSTPQSSVENSNSSFCYQSELRPVKDNGGNEKTSVGKNYSNNIHKKMYSEKGLTTQSHNSKSSEVVAHLKSESMKLAKSKIQKHLSEPQFLSKGYQTAPEIVSSHSEKHELLFPDSETLDGQSKMDNENVGGNPYWSPFQKTNYNDRLNILDISNLSAKSSHSMKQIDHVTNERTMPCTMDVTLRNEGKGYGLSFEFLGSASEDLIQVPRITVVSSQGAAHKAGVLQRGDRVLAINGQNTTGLTAAEFEQLKEEAFGVDEIALTVEFDVTMRNVQLGTFDVCVTKTSRTGLVYNDFRSGSSLVVKGIVKGSPAHRCGSLFPGDEVLFANNIRQELYDVSKNTYERSESVIIRVRRNTFDEKFGNEPSLAKDEMPLFKTFDLSRTSIHSNHDSNKMFLEQELTLYRDPVAKDFGFLVGQDPSTRTVYITGIRPDGPADCSKVIAKNDIILQINGVDLEKNRDEPIIHLFHSNNNRLELKMRRIFNYE